MISLLVFCVLIIIAYLLECDSGLHVAIKAVMLTIGVCGSIFMLSRLATTTTEYKGFVTVQENEIKSVDFTTNYELEIIKRKDYFVGVKDVYLYKLYMYGKVIKSTTDKNELFESKELKPLIIKRE